MIRLVLRAGVEIPNWLQIKRALPHLAARIQATTELPNPDFLEAQRLGRSTWGIPVKIKLWRWQRDTGTLVLPHGYLPHLLQILDTMRIRAEVTDARALRLAGPITSRIQLRDYQTPAVEAVLQSLEVTGLGLLVAPPGSGKTEMGLEVAARLQQSTLWLTHTLDLARQARDRAEARLGIPAAEIGMLGDGEERIGSFLTIGLIQTLARRDLSAVRNRWGLVVLDEAHHVPAQTWSQVVGSLAARYRLALTGTLERRDGLETVTQMFFGPVSYRVQGQGDSTGTIVPELHVVRTETVPEAWVEYEQAHRRWKETGKGREPRMPWSRILQELLEDEGRNARITELLAGIAPGRRTLVLSVRVSHCEELARRLRERLPHLRIDVIHGGTPKLERATILDDTRNGLVDVLFSVNIAKEGLDVPCLDQLVLVGASRDPIYIRQAIGRIQRPAPGKHRADVWDVADFACPVLRAQYWQRARIYREMGMVKEARAQRTA